ncbi:flagellar hook assembly protein FlgD [Propionivibrio dicarboxylicus]|uniref:Basal-body rod modification protein FlgD n=1 Tax=Propionivibrio dicarboxylicus TaxID=83767 RepID=A0A1G8HEW2_9RHOO|nr:flagellar hook capping FlgD N-terminal domain-containing protein [Propionivibrio dicarboxylicus]SDI05217.1 flagellar basal-body rod modification protein FlgD [Propionivibrio dicarboxylicus]
MTTTSGVTSTSSTTSTSSSNSTTTAADIQNRFMTLLVAQLQNQDPLNPLDNTQITSQLSQMSTVQGVEQLNTTLNSLVSSLADTQAVQASALIGKTVLVPGSSLTLSTSTNSSGTTTTSAYGGVNLASAADAVTVKIYDSSGNLVQTQSLGKADAGSMLFNWDGTTSSGTTASTGSYTFKVTATKGTESVTATALDLGTVSALTRASSGNFVLDLGSKGTVSFDDVYQVY